MSSYAKDHVAASAYPNLFQYSMPEFSENSGVPLVVLLHGAYGFGIDFWLLTDDISTICDTSGMGMLGPFNGALSGTINEGITPLEIASWQFGDEPGNVAAWGAYGIVMGSRWGREPLKDSIQYMLDKFPNIDRNKIYLVGFSSGGSDIMANAAQMLDPDGIMFAGIILGECVFNNLHYYSVVSAGAPGEIIGHQNGQIFASYGSGLTDYAPSTLSWVGAYQGPNWGDISGLNVINDTFAWERRSGLSYDPKTSAVTVSACQLKNLKHIPIFQSWDISQTLPFVTQANTIAKDYFEDGGDFCGGEGINHPMIKTIRNSGGHTISALDYQKAFDHIASSQASLILPASGDVLMAESGRFFNVSAQSLVSDLGWAGFSFFESIDTFNLSSNVNLSTSAIFFADNSIMEEATIGDLYFNSEGFTLIVRGLIGVPWTATRDGTPVASSPTTWYLSGEDLVLRPGLETVTNWVVNIV